MANRTPPTSPLVKRKEDEHEDEDQDESGRGKGKGRKKIKKGKSKDKNDVGNETQGGGKVTMDINPIVKAKITPVLPDFLDIKKIVCTLRYRTEKSVRLNYLLICCTQRFLPLIIYTNMGLDPLTMMGWYHMDNDDSLYLSGCQSTKQRHAFCNRII